MLGQLRHDQRGSVLVLTALAMMAFIGFAALAADGGFLFFTHTRLQDMADSSALAAAVQLVRSPGNADKKKQDALGAAMKSLRLNGLGVSYSGGSAATVSRGEETGHVNISIAESLDQVQVDLDLTAQLFFARGLTSRSPLAVRAVVQIGQASKQTGNLVPVAFFWGDYEWYRRYDLTLGPGSGASGNYGYLDYGPSNMFMEYLRDGYSGTLTVGQQIQTYPGVKTGQVRQAIESRLSRCYHGCSVVRVGDEVLVNVKPDCPRAVIVPVVSDFFEQNGRSYVTVLGFAKFFIESYDDSSKVLRGWFLQDVSSSDIIPGTPRFTLQSVKLVR